MELLTEVLRCPYGRHADAGERDADNLDPIFRFTLAIRILQSSPYDVSGPRTFDKQLSINSIRFY